MSKQTNVSSIAEGDSAISLLQPGFTCWRRAQASRVTVLIDNREYFSALRNSLEIAEQSVMLAGWQFDPRTVLEPGTSSNAGPQVGALLRQLAQKHPPLDIRLLVWDMSLPITMTRSFYPHRARTWFDERVQLVLDAAHLRGACRHQKLAIFDASIAFCSGADLAVNRWDSELHLDDDCRRKLPSGRPHPPRHSLSIAFDGAAARAVDDLCRERWGCVDGTKPPAPRADATHSLWPRQLPPMFEDIEIGIARTEPNTDHGEPIREIESLLRLAIATARKIIYIEDQYFASPAFADLLAARLQETHGPEIIVITSLRAANVFDRLIMDPVRDTLLEQLRAADRFARFGVYSPMTAAGRPILVHSKALIVDDRLLRIGSANLTNRSMGFDSECDVAVDAMCVPPARRRAVQDSIRACRLSLLAHHTGKQAPEILASIEQHGSVLSAIECISNDARQARLRPFNVGRLGPLQHLIARYQIGDPSGSTDAWRPWRRRKIKL